MRVARSLLWFSVLVCVGCGGSSGTPKAALHQYSKALSEGDSALAYKMMSAKFRSEHSQEQFVQMLKDNALEARETASRLSGQSTQVSMTAEFEYGLDDHMRLVWEGNEWRVASNPLAFYDQRTPRTAVRSFVRAYALKRWEIMLRFVPKSYRERMTVEMVRLQFEGPRKQEMSEMMETLRVNLNAPTSDTQKGNEARIRYGETYEVELMREDGLWKIKRL